MQRYQAQDLVHQRNRVWHEMKAMLDRATRSGRNMTPSERHAFEQAEQDLDNLDALLAEGKRAREADRLREPYGAFVQPASGGYRSGGDDWESWERFLREPGSRYTEVNPSDHVRFHRHQNGAVEVRDLATTSSAVGGATVPTSFLRQLFDYLAEEAGYLRLGVTVVNTTSGENLELPKVLTHGTAAIVGEGTALAENDPTLAKVTLGTWKYSQLLQVTRELVDDAGVDITAWVARDMARAVAAAVGGHFISGNGTTQVQGIFNAAGTGVTGQTASTGVPSYANLVDVVHSVASPYRQRASWLWKDSTLAAIRKITDPGGHYIWQPSAVVGQPDTLLGFPTVGDPAVNAAGTAVNCGMFGDFSGYVLRQMPLRIERSDDYAFGNDIVTFRAIQRVDGDLVDTNSVKIYRGGAS